MNARKELILEGLKAIEKSEQDYRAACHAADKFNEELAKVFVTSELNELKLLKMTRLDAPFYFDEPSFEFRFESDVAGLRVAVKGGKFAEYSVSGISDRNLTISAAVAVASYYSDVAAVIGKFCFQEFVDAFYSEVVALFKKVEWALFKTTLDAAALKTELRAIELAEKAADIDLREGVVIELLVEGKRRSYWVPVKVTKVSPKTFKYLMSCASGEFANYESTAKIDYSKIRKVEEK